MRNEQCVTRKFYYKYNYTINSGILSEDFERNQLNFILGFLENSILSRRYLGGGAGDGDESFRFNSVKKHKDIDQTALKAFADDPLNLTDILKFVLVRVENIVGKGEKMLVIRRKCLLQAYLPFSKCFQMTQLRAFISIVHKLYSVA